jgi:hypothetical protein
MIAAAGMLSDPKYAAKMEQKRALAKALGVRLLVLTAEKALTLDQVFQPWLTTAGTSRSATHRPDVIGRTSK